ncbi:putative long-chain-alcohol O-fatty-acyltransferase 8 [Leucoagaricus sp. SymC.cos]|nr:putative long-chain-alcohol O-fatty-acyltransferase 8 [Leucoagaricus sp. SymC.cos]
MRTLLIWPHAWFSSRIYDFVAPPEARGPLTWQSASTDFLPPFVLLYLTAYLVQTPGTLPIRLTLLPISLWSFFRAATYIDVVYGLKYREGLVYWNMGLVITMMVGAARCIAWSYQRTPYKRLYRIPGKTIQKENHDNRLWDALDLVANLRGHGWSWSRGLQVPVETRPTHSRGAFLITTLVNFIKYIVIADHIHYAIQWFGPTTLGSPYGGSIHHPTLPPIQNFLRSTVISFLGGLLVYTSITTVYEAFTLIGVGIFNQHPLQWPPMFDAPWMATSLTEFWARRWHQLFRDIFISVGGKPLSMLIGRIGNVMGTFIASGFLHDFGLWGMGRGTEFPTVGGYFLIQGVGVILEHTWKHFTGSRVGGVLGRIWTLSWVVIWGQLIVDAWCRKGLAASIFHSDQYRPSYLTLGPLPLPSY